MSSLNKNTTGLQEILDIVNNLPEASQLPSYYNDYMVSKVSQIKSLLSDAGDNKIAFAMFSDSHMELSGSALNGGNSGKLIYEAMKECQIPLALHIGDAQSNSPQPTEAKAIESLEKFNEMVEPLQGRIFQILGNHDGAWGEPADTNGDGTADTYPYNLTRDKTYKYALGKNHMGLSAVFCADGSYFYVDDHTSHTRFIMLNMCDKPYQTNANGTMADSGNTMKGFVIRQTQIDWMISSLNVPEGWSVITCTHAPVHPNVVGWDEQFRGILKAYKDKTAYTATYAGIYGWDALNINADFRNYKGDFIVHLCGHAHNDYHYKASGYGIDMMTVACDGRVSNNTYMTDESYQNRALGTVYEQCVDVVVIDKNDKTISTVRLGAGANRIISYTGAAVAYTVTNNLTSCQSNNATAKVAEGGSYTATITPVEGYVIDTVKVTMGGTDITASAYSNGVVSISNVTGNIVITAIAYAEVVEIINLWDMSARTEYVKADVTLGQSSSSQLGGGDTRTINFAKYVRGATSNGNWSFNTNVQPTISNIGEDSFTMAIKSSNVGLGMPVNLEKGKTYKLTYTVDATHTVYATYFNANGVYTTSTAIESAGSAGTYSKTFTVGSDAYIQLTFRGAVGTYNYSGIVLEKV